VIPRIGANLCQDRAKSIVEFNDSIRPAHPFSTLPKGRAVNKKYKLSAWVTVESLKIDFGENSSV